MVLWEIIIVLFVLRGGVDLARITGFWPEFIVGANMVSYFMLFNAGWNANNNSPSTPLP